MSFFSILHHLAPLNIIPKQNLLAIASKASGSKASFTCVMESEKEVGYLRLTYEPCEVCQITGKSCLLVAVRCVFAPISDQLAILVAIRWKRGAGAKGLPV